LQIRIAYEWTEDYVIKYLWSAAGYCLIYIPVLFSRQRPIGVEADPRAALKDVSNAVANRTESAHLIIPLSSNDYSFLRLTDYISSRRLLLSLADAGGRLMYAYKDILELAGLTTRLYTLLSSLHNLPPLPMSSPAGGETPHITLENVDVSIPTSGVHEAPLVRALYLTLCAGEHLMITGSNGVGKTAVARVLSGLWAPGNEGKVHRPSRGEVFVVPQRAYMVTGSLLDQYVLRASEKKNSTSRLTGRVRIIYPHTYPQFVRSGRTNEELMEILEAVHLAYLPAREGGWETRKEWRGVLSGGEKQRVSESAVLCTGCTIQLICPNQMAMARVFYHKPKFAILDGEWITIITLSLR